MLLEKIVTGHRNLFGVAMITLMTLAGCMPINSPVAPPATPTAALVPVRVGTLPFISNAILKLAEAEGYFAEQGLDVELVLFRSPNELTPLLIKGELDAAAPGLTAGFFNAIAKGARIRAALPLTSFSPTSCSVVSYLARQSDAANGNYDSFAQWQGVNLGVPPAGQEGMPGYLTDMILQQAGLTLKDVTLTPLDTSIQGEALRSGQVDLLYAVEPLTTRLMSDGDVAVLTTGAVVAPDLTASIVAFGPAFLDNPDMGRRFAQAYLKAVRQYREGKTARNVAIIAAHTGLDPALVKAACWVDIPPEDAINADSIMAYQRWLQAQGLLEQLVLPENFIVQGLVEEN